MPRALNPLSLPSSGGWYRPGVTPSPRREPGLSRASARTRKSLPTWKRGSPPACFDTLLDRSFPPALIWQISHHLKDERAAKHMQ